MRLCITTLFILIISLSAFGQAPEGFTYQAVARDASGEILANQNVSLRISILQGSISGSSVYTETHTASSNSFGLINLEIGDGTTSESFSAIDWSNGPYFIKVEMDPTGGTSYAEFGTSQLLSVPYAMHAKTAENTFSGSYADLAGTPFIPSNVSDLTNDTGFITDPADADSDPTNEIQDITLTGAELSISDGSTVDLSGLATGGSETDPEVGANTLNFVPKWDGGALVTSSIFDNGKIGIGTSDPSEILHISSTGVPNIRVDAPGDNGYYIGFNAAGYMAFSTIHSGTPYLDAMILKEGRMGIGTITPTATLDIAGNLNLSGSNQFGTALIAESSLPHTGPHESVLMLQNDSDDPSSEANLQFASGSPAHGRATISATHDISAGLYNGNLDLEVRNGTTSYIKALTIRSSGNVGIGNTDPLTKLDVGGVITATGGNSDQWNEAFGWGNHADAGYLTSIGAESDPEVGTNILNYLSKWDGAALVSSSIFDNGNVGIGVTDPEFTLDVGGMAYVEEILNIAYNDVPFTDVGIGSIFFGGRNSAGDMDVMGTSIMSKATEDWSGGTYGSEMLFNTTTTGGPLHFTMVLKDDGKVGIGEIFPQHLLSVAGMIQSTIDGYKFPDGTVQTTAAIADPADEIQDLQLVTNTLTITNNPTPTDVDLSPYLDNTDEQNLENVLTQGADAGGLKIENLADPVNDMDAATKAYVDELENRVASFEYAMLGNSNGMVLWNKLGSVFESENSVVGPNGIIIGAVNFNNDVKYGKGATPNGRGDGNGIDFPTTVADPESGTVEMWAEFYEPPIPGQYGVYGFVNSAHWTHNVVAFYWHNSGSNLDMTLGFNGTIRGATKPGFSPPINEPVHLAFVWDRGGIDGSGDYMRIYVDGIVVATNTTENDWGIDNSSGNFRVAAPWDSNYETDRYSLDNIKIWDHAKTNFGDRDMDGSITGTVQVESINVNQITGLLGQGYTVNFPEILDNLVTLEIMGITIHDKVVMVSSTGQEIERIEGFGPGGPTFDPGLSMEYPIIFETTSQQDADEISSWFATNPGGVRNGSVIIKNSAGNETSRWVFLEYTLMNEETGVDGRIRFTLNHAMIPDNTLGCEWDGVNGVEWAYNPDTDVLFEISGISHEDFCPQVEIDEVNNTLTLTYDYNEGGSIYNWVKDLVHGIPDKRVATKIITSDGSHLGTELERLNYFECFPIKFEHFYGFGLNSKLKTRVVLSFDWWEIAN